MESSNSRTATGSGLAARIAAVLAQHLSPAISRTVMDCASTQKGLPPEAIGPRNAEAFLADIRRGVRLFAKNDHVAAKCIAEVERLLAWPEPARVELRVEADVLAARTVTRSICVAIGFTDPTLTKVLTALAELTRNVLQYAGSGEVRIAPVRHPAGIEIVVEDGGPGIANLPDVLAGRFKSRRGMGVGLRGAKALADDMTIETSRTGTSIIFRKRAVR
jgi:serine/threonine-protein kinase RsbT